LAHLILRIARWTIYVGIALVIVGIVAGFTAMFLDFDDIALAFLALAPVGIFLIFAGLVLIVMLEPRS
jgi:hypothetical protein